MFQSRRLSTSIAALGVVAACAAAATAPPSWASRGVVATHQSSTNSQATTAVAAAPGKYTSRVLGSFGRVGTVRGHFVPQRSFVKNGHVVVQGDLTARLRRGNGTLVGVARRHDVTLPVRAPGAHLASAADATGQTAAAAATCTILHLVLGPLDLNLLGLMVHLNRVVLDITAVSGAGNLLGNLLCAVAHLLDNTSPTITSILRLSSLLNRIVGLIT